MLEDLLETAERERRELMLNASGDVILPYGRGFAELWGVVPTGVAYLAKTYAEFFEPERGGIKVRNFFAISEEAVRRRKFLPELAKRTLAGRINRVWAYLQENASEEGKRSYEEPEPLLTDSEEGERSYEEPKPPLTLTPSLYMLETKRLARTDVVVYNPRLGFGELVKSTRQQLFHIFWEEVGTVKSIATGKKGESVTAIWIDFPNHGLKKMSVNYTGKLAEHWDTEATMR